MEETEKGPPKKREEAHQLQQTLNLKNHFLSISVGRGANRKLKEGLEEN